MGQGGPSRSHRILDIVGALLILTSFGAVLFWAVTFADLDRVRSTGLAVRHSSWFDFELAFPLADGWMTASAMVGGLGVWRRRAWGLLWGLLAASSLIFLALMDILFFARADLYRPLDLQTGLELAIHVYALALGALVIPVLWRRREVFLGDRPALRSGD